MQADYTDLQRAAQEDYEAAWEDWDAREEQQRQDDLQRLREECDLYNRWYHITQGQPVPRQPVTHR